MKKFIIPLLTMAVVVSIIFAGCAAPAPTPAPAPAPPAEPTRVSDVPELQDLVSKGAIDPNLLINPYEGLAIKADGKPYIIACTFLLLGGDWMSSSEGLLRSLTTRAGAEYIMHNGDLNPEIQVAWMEDQIAAGTTDIIILDATDEAMLAPSTDKAIQAGIPVFTWDIEVFSDEVAPLSYHDFDGPAGTNVIGEWFVEQAEKTGKPIHIFEIWGMRSMQTAVDRSAGFHSAVDGHPLITVTESADSNWSDEVAANLVMDAFGADPTLNAIYIHGTGTEGAKQALKGIGKLYKVGDPNHVMIGCVDIGAAIIDGMDEGYVDVCDSHGPWDLVDVVMKLAYTNVILGKPVPDEVAIPLVAIDTSNVDTLKIFGVPATWPRMPLGEWDIWPVMDTSEIGLETPTK